MKKKFAYIVIFQVILLVLLCSCNTSEQKQYYSEKDNYIEATGVVSFISYDDTNEIIYLGFSDLSPQFDDNSFKIVGANVDIAEENSIDQKIEIGTKVDFITAPRYFGDGQVMPIVAMSVDEDEILNFEEGFNNFLEWIG